MSLILYTFLLFCGLQSSLMLPNWHITPEQDTQLECNVDVFDWELLLDALQDKESDNIPNAINVIEDAVGILQIRPIYLKDINRIIGYKRYTLKDRYDIIKSREMVRIFFSYYVDDENINEIIAMHCSGPKGKEKLKYNKLVMHYVDDVLKIRNKLIMENKNK